MAYLTRLIQSPVRLHPSYTVHLAVGSYLQKLHSQAAAIIYTNMRHAFIVTVPAEEDASIVPSEKWSPVVFPKWEHHETR